MNEHVLFQCSCLSLIQTGHFFYSKLDTMRDFLLLIKTEGSVWADLPPQQLQEHIRKGTAYIGKLMKDGKLRSAHPVDKGSRIVTEIMAS